MTAKEALELSFKYRNEKYVKTQDEIDNEINDCYKKIKEAAKSGSVIISINGFLNEKTTLKLKEDGFLVTQNSSWTNIAWFLG